MDDRSEKTVTVVGGVDTHKDLHVAAVVDRRDHVVGTRSSPRPGRATGGCSSGCNRLVI